MQICPNCGEENPDRFRLCGICGTKLVPDETASEVRKNVTIVFTDLKGSTTLGETLDTEALREVLNVYFNEMRAVVERHGGTVQKYIGDAIVAVFGLPRLHEDDAVRAVRAASEMRETLARVNDRIEATWGVRLHNRTGVYTGEVVAGDVSAGQHLVTGDAANTAARLEQNAPTDEILIGDTTYRLVRDAVEVEPVEPLPLKGKAEPVPAYRLLSVTGDEGLARRLDSPLVGREDELGILLDALKRAGTEHRAQLVTVFGPAGVGKSRLLVEFRRRAGEGIPALQGRCLSYGDGITFWPLAEVVRQAAGIDEEDSLEEARGRLVALAGEGARDAADRVAAAIGLSDESFPIQETFWGVRRLVELVIGDTPTIVVVDDIHWAEDTFLELLRYLADTTTAPLILVCSSRPDLLEGHAEWVQEQPHVKRILLEPLSAEESERVVANLLGTTELEPSVRDRVVQSAEGNPLFVEQMIAMLIDDGTLGREPDGRWTVSGSHAAIDVPPSISALLSARLDRLSATERAVIERGAVIGHEFFRGAVEFLSPESVKSFVGPSLQSLVRKELIRPKPSTLLGEETFRFLHGLIRESAYQGLLKRARAELHEAFVEWSILAAPDRGMEYEEIRGFHLEQAYLIRAQLAPMDEDIRQLGIRGSGYLAGAGLRALARGDMPAAASLLQRAGMIRPVGGADRARLLMLAGEAMIETGDFSIADDILAAAEQDARSAGDEALAVTIRLVELLRRYLIDPESIGIGIGIVEEVQGAISLLEADSCHEGLARAWRVLVHVHATEGRYGWTGEAARKQAEHARLAGDPILEARALPALAQCAVYGPTPVPEGIELCQQLLERTGNDRKATAMTLCALAHLQAMRGEFEEARELYRQSRAALVELGWHLHAALTSIDSGPVEMLAGDPRAAEAELRLDHEALDRMGERNYISTTSGLLAEALYRQDRLEEALRYAEACRELAAEDDVTSQGLWRTVRGKVLSREGRVGEALALTHESIGLVRRTDDLDALGHFLMDRAEVLETAGRADEAIASLEEALECFERKENRIAAASVRERLDRLRAMASDAPSDTAAGRSAG